MITERHLKQFAAVCAALALVPILLVLIAQFNDPGTLSVTDMEWASLGGLLLLGGAALFYFSHLANDKWRVTVDEINKDLEDDVEDLREGNPTLALVYSGATILSTVTFVVLGISYREFAAAWFGWLSVTLVGIGASAAIVAIVVNTQWFHDEAVDHPTWLFLIPMVGLALSTGFGIYYTEPINSDGLTQYNYDGTRAAPLVNNYHIYSVPRLTASHSTCHGKGCGLAVLLVILVIVLTYASATVPHFWLVAGLIWCTIMGLFSVQRLLRRPDTVSEPPAPAA